jgi:NADPH-dependent ferric siderophore reductase
VRRTEALTPHLVRVVVGGAELAGLDPGLPGASVRLLLPAPGAGLVLPAWNGNEFLLPDDSRPILRTLTPRRVDADQLELTVDVVVHDGSPLSVWATTSSPGDPIAVSGTGRGYTIDPDIRSLLLAGDEAAIPAVSQLLEALAPEARTEVLLEVRDAAAQLELPAHPAADVRWLVAPADSRPGDALLAAVIDAAVDPATRVWAAGEAAAMQRIRKHLFEERGFVRAGAVVRGYWKQGRSGEPDG